MVQCESLVCMGAVCESLLSLCYATVEAEMTSSMCQVKGSHISHQRLTS